MIDAADLFCGAGGSSTGLVHACRKLGIEINLLAVNHWKTAVATHTQNHPWARHMCADLSSIDPSLAIPGGKLRILVASPECTHHSNARGGKPRSDQSRASAWHILHWAERLQIDDILIENVAEFQSWGPLNRYGKPVKRRKGDTFRVFLKALEAMGYSVDYRIMNAADYGDATTRRRLFIQARRGRKISWPDPSHAGRWRAAREIIDWDLKGESIFTRKKPLRPNTLKRIEAGLLKFGGAPFLTILRRHADGTSLNNPVPTITAGGTHIGLAEPFLVEYYGDSHQQQKRIRSVNDPLPTQSTENRFGLCEPFIIPMEHSGRQPVRSTDKPLPTITTARAGSFGLCEPFVMNVAHQGSDESRCRSVDDPLSTIPAGHRGELALCEPFLTKYYGSGEGVRPVDEPLDTVTVRDRFALCEPIQERHGMDIRFRMLQPHELAAAMGFDAYQFTGNKTEIVKQIGNAVPVHLSEALCTRLLS
jgi:DNA (cytosine-5)-methyltransferase 1